MQPVYRFWHAVVKWDYITDRSSTMREYTLNDIKYNEQEISLFVKDDNYVPDKKKLEKEFEKNRELMRRFKSDYKELFSNTSVK